MKIMLTTCSILLLGGAVSMADAAQSAPIAAPVAPAPAAAAPAGTAQPLIDPAAAAEMQKFAVELQAMQQCMNSVGQEKLSIIQQKGTAISNKVHQLCKAGQINAAQAYALAEGRKMMADPTVQALTQCSGDMGKQILALYHVDQGKTMASQVCGQTVTQ